MFTPQATETHPLPLFLPLKGRDGRGGFTLIEIVITIVLVGILAGLAGMIILQGARMFSSGEARSDVHHQARLAVERIAREARHIRSCTASDLLNPANPSSTLSFVDINGNSVTFSVTGGNLMRGTDLLASGISSAQPFSYLADNGTTLTTACTGTFSIWFIDIDVIDTKGAETARLRARVHPRNF